MDHLDGAEPLTGCRQVCGELLAGVEVDPGVRQAEGGLIALRDVADQAETDRGGCHRYGQQRQHAGTRATLRAIAAQALTVALVFPSSRERTSDSR